MSRRIALGTLFLVLLGSGGVAGLWSGRWGRSSSVQEAVDRLGQVPVLVGGNWDVHEDKLTARALAVAEVDGHLYRHYLHRQTGQKVSVLLVCGRPGPIAIHTPVVCFAGAGYLPTAPPRAYEGSAGRPYQFQVHDFRQGNVATPTLLRVFVSWGYRGTWSVPANPRWAFAGRPSLYKLYLIRALTRADEPIEPGPDVELMKDLMPQLQQTLFPGTRASS
jgi:hypothetical protein